MPTPARIGTGAPALAAGAPRGVSRTGVSRFLIAAGFALVSLAMRAAVRVYFRRLHVRHLARFPRRGPVLLVANHPAMWTDVLVLDVALGRKLHFLAQGELFRPAWRGLLLELHGALPVFHASGLESRSHNQATFVRCRELFARGEVVALFPEGVSASDRQVLQLKTGAARIALDAAAHAAPGSSAPMVMASGIHYADRTSYGSEVTVSVGAPLDLESWLRLEHQDAEVAVHALTDALQSSLRTLILDLPEPALASAVSELEPLAGLSPLRGMAELESAQRIAAALGNLRVTEPRRFERIRQHARAYRRARRALRLSDRALTWDPARAVWRQQTGLLALCCTCFRGPPGSGSRARSATTRPDSRSAASPRGWCSSPSLTSHCSCSSRIPLANRPARPRHSWW